MSWRKEPGRRRVDGERVSLDGHEVLEDREERAVHGTAPPQREFL